MMLSEKQPTESLKKTMSQRIQKNDINQNERDHSTTKRLILNALKQKEKSSETRQEQFEHGRADRQQYLMEDDSPNNRIQKTLNKKENLQVIQKQICELVKSKTESMSMRQSEDQNQQENNGQSYDDQVQINPQEFEFEEQQQEQQQNYMQSSSGYAHNTQRSQFQDTQEVQGAGQILQIAHFIKQKLSDYALQDTICILSKQLLVLKRNLDLPSPDSSKKNKAKPSLPLAPQSQFEQSRVTRFKPNFYQNKLQQMSKSDVQVDNARKKVNIPSDAMKIREQKQRQIANIFITHGYGLHIARNELKKQMTPNHYNSLLSSIIRSAIRRTCDILIKNLGKNSQPFTVQQERLLRSPMVNCRRWLPVSELNTFYKIINIVYEIKHEPIYEDEVLSLYDKMQKQLVKRTQGFQSKSTRDNGIENKIPMPVKSQASTRGKNYAMSNVSEMFPMRESKAVIQTQPIITTPHPSNVPLIGDPAIEKQIAQLYVNFKNEKSVFLVLSKKHPQSNWAFQDVKTTIDRLIRIGIKKVIKHWKQYSATQQNPQALNLSEGLVNRLLGHPIAQPVRVAMVQCLMEKKLSFETTSKLVKFINGCITQITRNK